MKTGCWKMRSAGRVAAIMAMTVSVQAYAEIVVANRLGAVTEVSDSNVTTANFTLNDGNAVLFMIGDESGSIIAGVTFAGEPMEAVLRNCDKGGQTAAIYYLLNPRADSGVFVVSADGSDPGGRIAYDALSLWGVGGIAKTDSAQRTSDGSLEVRYTTQTDGGFVVDVCADNGWDGLYPKYSSDILDTKLFQNVLANNDGAVAIVYGDIPAAGTYANTWKVTQRGVAVTLAFEVSDSLPSKKPVTRYVDASNATSYPSPERKKMSIGEVEARMYDLDGTVIEVWFTYASELTQTGPGEYRVFLGCFNSGESWSGRTVYFSGEEARDFFREAVEDSGGYASNMREEVYLFVDGKSLRAVGTHYNKGKEEYSW